MIILSALSFTTSYHISTTWRFALHLLSLSICQRSLSGMKAEGWSVRNLPPHLHGQTSRGLAETRGLGPQCRAGSRLSCTFIYIFTETRELQHAQHVQGANLAGPNDVRPITFIFLLSVLTSACAFVGTLQKGGVPAAPSGTATLLRLSPNHQFCLRPILAVTDFRHPRLSWLDGRCVQGPGTYSPRHG